MTDDKKKNPAFEVCDAIYFLAYKDGKVVGRIAGMINRRSNETWNQKYARFGFVDFIDDAEVVDALFGAVEKWGAARADGIYRYGSRRNADRGIRPDRDDGDHL